MKRFLWDMFAFVGLLIIASALAVLVFSFAAVVVTVVVLLASILAYAGARTTLKVRRWRVAR